MKAECLGGEKIKIKDQGGSEKSVCYGWSGKFIKARGRNDPGEVCGEGGGKEWGKGSKKKQKHSGKWCGHLNLVRLKKTTRLFSDVR